MFLMSSRVDRPLSAYRLNKFTIRTQKMSFCLQGYITCMGQEPGNFTILKEERQFPLDGLLKDIYPFTLMLMTGALDMIGLAVFLPSNIDKLVSQKSDRSTAL